MKTKAMPADLKGVPKAAIKVRRLCCPLCRKTIPKAVRGVQNHFLLDHQQDLTEAEAHRIATATKPPKRAPYEEELRRNWQEVSGGLPSLGKGR